MSSQTGATRKSCNKTLFRRACDFQNLVGTKGRNLRIFFGKIKPIWWRNLPPPPGCDRVNGFEYLGKESCLTCLTIAQITTLDSWLYQAGF